MVASVCLFVFVSVSSSSWSTIVNLYVQRCWIMLNLPDLLQHHIPLHFAKKELQVCVFLHKHYNTSLFCFLNPFINLIPNAVRLCKTGDMGQFLIKVCRSRGVTRALSFRTHEKARSCSARKLEPLGPSIPTTVCPCLSQTHLLPLEALWWYRTLKPKGQVS